MEAKASVGEEMRGGGVFGDIVPRFRRVYISAVVWRRERKDKKNHHNWTEEEAGRGTSGQSNHFFIQTTNNNLLVQRHPGVST